MCMKHIKIIFILVVIIPLLNFPQDKEKDSIQDKPERSAFESSFIIDNPTNVVFSKKTLEIQMSHRFGLINGGENDLAGFWAPSNIRIGISYTVIDRVAVGFGTTKFDRLQDFNWKVTVLRQTRSGKIPLSLTYYGNFTIDARKKENFVLVQHRYSNFHQLIFAKRFSSNFSLQIAPSISHYNLAEKFERNDRFSIALGGRFKISSQTAILFDYSQPLTQFDTDPERPNVNFNRPGISIGAEFATSGHAFQLFITNYNGLVPQKNYSKNEHDFFNGDFLIGFNITRIYNF